MKLIMTLLVRDEVDIIKHNLVHHLGCGVDHVIVIDNGSVDGTRDILADFEQQSAITILDEPDQNYQQGIWMTRAALMARDVLGADWILNNDADEFWVSRNGNLKSAIGATNADILSCRRKNFVFPWDTPVDQPWFESCIFRVEKKFKMPRLKQTDTDVLPCPYFYLDLPDKILTRADRLVEIKQGNHNATYSGEVTRDAGEIDILHFPIRSKAQFMSKVINGGEAYAANSVLPIGTGWHVRRHYNMLMTHGVDAAMADALPSSKNLVNDLDSGAVVKIDHLQDLLGLKL